MVGQLDIHVKNKNKNKKKIGSILTSVYNQNILKMHHLDLAVKSKTIILVEENLVENSLTQLGEDFSNGTWKYEFLKESLK